MADLERNTIERARCIRAVIHSEEQRLRAMHPWLAHQDLLGMTCFLGSLAAMVCVGVFYLQGGLVWWFAVLLMALPISILHELEHDLIHNLYFRSRVWVQHLMFFVIWFCKLSLNPWYRRGIHLKHHLVSGQKTDIEERLIGLGLPFGFLRLLVTIHPMGGLFLFRRIKRESPDFQPLRLALLSVPTYTLFLVIWESFFGYVRVHEGWALLYDPSRLLPVWGWPWARDLTVLLVLPNVLRQSCLVLMSSYSHYYEDIPERDIFFQNQILSNWMLFPFQLFCFNFGATHIVHHYVINQPFYLRQMVAHAAQAEMGRQGTRINDLGTFVRANRRGTLSRDASSPRALSGCVKTGWVSRSTSRR
jgi:fatty acid desaturase